MEHSVGEPLGFQNVPRGTFEPPSEVIPDAPAGPLELLRRGLAELGLAPDEAVIEGLSGLAELVAGWTHRVDLTAHGTPEAVVRHLVLDALALDAALPDVPSLVDLGSGAGFPGLPLALLHPSREVVLIEARERRHHFLRMAVRSLGIGNVVALRGRAERLTPRRTAAVVAQAVGAPEVVLGWMARWALPGGLLALPQARRAGFLASPPGVEPLGWQDYRVPLGGPERLLWLGRRVEDAPEDSTETS